MKHYTCDYCKKSIIGQELHQGRVFFNPNDNEEIVLELKSIKGDFCQACIDKLLKEHLHARSNLSS